MRLQDVAFLPSKASLPTMFLKHCGRGESLGTITCLKTVVGGKQGHALCKILSLQQSPFLVSVECHGDRKTVIKMRQNLATLSVEDVTGFKTVESLSVIDCTHR